MQSRDGTRTVLTLAETELALPEGKLLNQSMGSVMHGLLMETISNEWADAMHSMDIRPFSQYLVVRDGKPYWRIATLTEEAFEHILMPVMKLRTAYLRQHSSEIGFGPFQICKKESSHDLEKKFFETMGRIHHVEMRFCTSTSFKTNGTYAIFPDPRLLFCNLIAKWNAFSTSSVLEEDNLAQHIADRLYITEYNLHTHPYSLEGRRIAAFRGTLRLGLFKSDMNARLASLLCYFASYCGTGIKTALGMGGTETLVAEYKYKEL